MERSGEGAFFGFLVGLVGDIVIAFIIVQYPGLFMLFFQDEHTALIIAFIFYWVIPVVLPILGAYIGYFFGKKKLYDI